MSIARVAAASAGAVLFAMSGAFAAGPVFTVDQPQFLAPYDERPAVSAFNGKFETAYVWSRAGEAGSGDDFSATGALAFPLGNRFGLQVDGGFAGLRGSAETFGVGAHLFWRRPETGLVGLYGDFHRVSGSDLDVWRLEVEGELYLGRFSLEGAAGAETVRGPGDRETYVSGEIVAAYYPTDDLRIHGGVGSRFDRAFARIGAEAILPIAANNVALFADGTFGEDLTTIRAGVRVYFGAGGKSLIARHREDDPAIRLFATPFPVNAPAAAAGGEAGTGEGGGSEDLGGGGGIPACLDGVCYY